MATEVKYRIRADDKTKKGIDSAKKNLGGLAKAAKVAGAAAAAAFAAAKIAQAIGKAFDFAEAGAAMTATRDAFTNMAASVGHEADNIIESLRRASRGTVAEMDLISAAARAAAFNLPLDELDKLMEIATASARAMGRSIKDSFDDLITGISRASPMIIDNLGITLKIGEATEQYAASIGKTAEELTGAERSQAVYYATLKAGESIIDRVGAGIDEITDAEKFAQATAAVDDFKNAIKERLAPALADAATALGRLFDKMRIIIGYGSAMESLNARVEEFRQQMRQGINLDMYEQALSMAEDINDFFELYGSQMNKQTMVYFTEAFGQLKELAADMAENVQKMRADEEAAAAAAAKRARELAAALKEWKAAEKIVNAVLLSQKTEKDILSEKLDLLKAQVGYWHESAVEAQNLAAAIAIIEGQLKTIAKIPPLFPSQAVFDAMEKARAGGGGGPDVSGILAAAGTGLVTAGGKGDESEGGTIDAIEQFKAALLDTTVAASGTAGQLLQAGISGGAMGLLMEALKPVIQGVMSVLGPAIDGILKPLMNAMFSIGQVVGVLLLPIFEALAPIVDMLLTVVMQLIEPISAVLAPIMDTLGWVLETLVVPVLKVVVSVFNMLLVPILWVTDVLAFFGETIKTLVHNIEAFVTRGMEAKEYQTYAETGGRTFAELIDEALAKNAELWADTGGVKTDATETLKGMWDGFDYDEMTFPELPGYEYEGAGGAAAQYTTGRKLTINIVINTDVIAGEGGIRALAVMLRDEIYSAEQLGY